MSETPAEILAMTPEQRRARSDRRRAELAVGGGLPPMTKEEYAIAVGLHSPGPWFGDYGEEDGEQEGITTDG